VGAARPIRVGHRDYPHEGSPRVGTPGQAARTPPT
jgi:hypothetical protein